LVARGFEQRHGIDFDEVFAPIVKWSTIRTLAACSALHNHPIHHLDVRTAFLYGTLEDEVYMVQPPGISAPGREHLVWKLKRALYDLRQSPRHWYNRIDTYLRSIGMTRSTSDYNMYHVGTGTQKIILVVYVDDLFITGVDDARISWLKGKLKTEFDITDLGQVTRYLGVEFRKHSQGLFLSQHSYVLDMLREFGIHDSRFENVPLPSGLQLVSYMESPPVNTHEYCRMVGKLIFLTTTRPNLAHAVGTVSRFMSAPQEAHLAAVKHIFRYVHKTSDYGINYRTGHDPYATGFTDVDWAQCLETRRSTSRYYFLMAGSAITWQSKRQLIVAKSSTEAEYVSLSSGTSEAVWIARLLHELGHPTSQCSLALHHASPTLHSDYLPITVTCDNQSALKLAKNLVFHARTKHIEVHHHFVRKRVLEGEVNLDYIPTDQQPMDIFTKPLSKTKFEQH
jgi:hypothetical protein